MDEPEDKTVRTVVRVVIGGRHATELTSRQPSIAHAEVWVAAMTRLNQALAELLDRASSLEAFRAEVERLGVAAGQKQDVAAPRPATAKRRPRPAGSKASGKQRRSKA